MTPVLIEMAAVMVAYRVVPHHTVQWRHAFAGALLAVVLLEAVKAGLGLYWAASAATRSCMARSPPCRS